MKNQKIDIKKKVIEGMNEEQAELLEESKRIKIVNWITDNLTCKNEFGNIELSLSLKQLELLLGFISDLLEEERRKKDKEISRLKHKDDDEPTKANYYAKGYRDGIKETIDSIIETLEEQYKQIK
jgi:hypothetical protein